MVKDPMMKLERRGTMSIMRSKSRKGGGSNY